MIGTNITRSLLRGIFPDCCGETGFERSSMAEIKSTLELVMEKTRHLHMTEEDKRKQAAQAFKEAVGRLAGKYLDGQISLEKFKSEFNRLGQGAASRKTDAAAEIGRRIDPAADNTPLLDLIRDGLGLDVSGIEATLRRFRKMLYSDEADALERIRVGLSAKGISGSAVIPNLESDKDWTNERLEMFEAVKAELAAQTAQLKQR